MPIRRHVAVLVAGLLVAVGLPLLLPQAASAAIVAPFTARFQANANGDIRQVGNSLMTCSTTVGNNASRCAAARETTSGSGAELSNGNHFMQFIDVDGDPSTFDSSQATLSLPGEAIVLHASLHWGGVTTAGGADSSLGIPRGSPPRDPSALGTVLLTGPTGERRTVSAPAGRLATDPTYDWYAASADVTGIVAGQGAGVWTVANVQSGTGADRGAGWALIVAYAAPGEPQRNLTVFDGLAWARPSDPVIDVPVAGFRTPVVGPVQTRVGWVGLDGDLGPVADQLTVLSPSSPIGQVLSDAANPANNIANSTVAADGVRMTGRTPGYANTMGFDADLFAERTGLLGNGDTSATVRLSAGTLPGAEYFYASAISFATRIYAPDLRLTKTVSDVDGGLVRPGDELEYVVRGRNVGFDPAAGTQLADPVPTGSTLVAGSAAARDLRTGASLAVTEAGGVLTVDAGTVPVGTEDQLELRFRVRVAGDAADGQVVVNTARVAYRGATTGTAYSGVSNSATVRVSEPRADLRVSKTADRAIVQVPGEQLVGYALTVTSSGPAPTPSGGRAGQVVLTDTPGVGGSVTAASSADPGVLCSVAAGAARCVLADADDPLGVGESVTVQVQVAVDPDAVGEGLGNSARVRGPNVDPDPSNDAVDLQVDVNHAPVARDDGPATAVGGAARVDVLANDTDADGDPLTVVAASVAQPAAGSVALDGEQLAFTVTDPAFKGTQTVAYTVSDGRGGQDDAVLTVVVPNAPPVPVDDVASAPLTAQPQDVDVLANDSDPNGDPLTVSSAGPVSCGTVSVVSGLVRFDPVAAPACDPGPVEIPYQVSDGEASASATLTMTLHALPPTAVADVVELPEWSDVPVRVEVLANDVAPLGGAPLSVAGVSTPVTPDGAEAGAAEADAGVVVWTPPPGFVGLALMTYTLCTSGPDATCVPGQVSVTVPNGPVTAADDTGETISGEPVTVDVLANDTDANGDPLVASVTGGPGAAGQAVVDDAGRLLFTPDPGYDGEAVVTYEACDGRGSCAEATVVITVSAPAVDAVDDEAAVAVNGSVEVSVLANDVVVFGGTDGQPVVTVISGPEHGSVTLADGVLTYAPDADFVGDDTLTYRLCDAARPTRACDEATVTVRVVNTPPTAAPDTASFERTPGGPAGVTIDVLANDTDPDGDTLRIIELGTPSAGSVRIEDGRVVYTPDPGTVGIDFFTYVESDGHGGTATGQVTVVVGNSAPVARDDAARATSGQATTVPVEDNDVDPNGDPLTVTAFTQPEHGTTSAGSVVYTSEAGFAGADGFDYTVCDPFGACASARVSVTVTVPATPTPTPTPTGPRPSPTPTSPDPDPTPTVPADGSAPPGSSRPPSPPGASAQDDDLAGTGFGSAEVAWLGLFLVLAGAGLLALSRWTGRGRRPSG